MSTQTEFTGDLHKKLNLQLENSRDLFRENNQHKQKIFQLNMQLSEARMGNKMKECQKCKNIIKKQKDQHKIFELRQHYDHILEQ